MAAFLFDLDMTLLDSSALETWRRHRLWHHVRNNLDHVKAFPLGILPPHALPRHVKSKGHRVAVVTASPRWYATRLLERFDIQTDVLVAWDDTERHKPDPEPITKALMDLGATPDDAFFVGDSTIDVEASYHAGVCSIGAGWGVKNFEELSSAAPDVLVLRPDGLLPLDELDRRGYLAEVVCSGATPKVHRGAILPCGESPRRFALGRYFTRSDPRHAASALAAATILQLKNSDTPAPLFARALAAFVHECGWTPDYVVPVPPKPSQDRNRFAAVIEEAEPLLPDDIAFVLDGLSCVREVTDYKTLSPPERAAAARGTFTSSYDWRRDKVLLLDDVLTTGETLAECTRVFAATGAAEVRAVVFGKDQQTFATKTCPRV